MSAIGQSIGRTPSSSKPFPCHNILTNYPDGLAHALRLVEEILLHRLLVIQRRHNLRKGLERVFMLESAERRPEVATPALQSRSRALHITCLHSGHRLASKANSVSIPQHHRVACIHENWQTVGTCIHIFVGYDQTQSTHSGVCLSPLSGRSLSRPAQTLSLQGTIVDLSSVAAAQIPHVPGLAVPEYLRMPLRNVGILDLQLPGHPRPAQDLPLTLGHQLRTSGGALGDAQRQ